MPQFDAINWVTLTGTLVNAANEPAEGVVLVSAYLTSQDTAHSKVIVLQPKEVKLVAGAFSTKAPSTTAEPCPIVEICFVLPGARPAVFRYKLITSASAVDISQLDGFEEADPPPDPQVFVAWSVVGQANGVASLGPDGKVPAGQLPPGGGGGVTDHGDLTGLGDDDHTQYLNQTRGDARYFTQAQVTTALAGKSDVGHAHSSGQITDFNTAVDARIQNVVAGAPGALDTLDELAAALGDDANFAATITTALSNKQPIDADLTTIAGLAPADGSVLARVAGAWNSRTAAQLKSDLGITAADVGLGNVADLAPADLPISDDTQAALDGKAPRVWVTDPMTKYGLVAATGRFNEFVGGAGGFSGQFVIAICTIPAGVSFSRMAMPIRQAGTFTPGSGKPNQLAWWNNAGQFQQATPDDDTMYSVADWYVADLPSNNPAQSTDRQVYAGFQISGWSGVGQYVLHGAFDSGGIPFSHAPGSSQRFAAYSTAVTTLGDFNPSTVGTITSYMPFIAFLP